MALNYFNVLPINHTTSVATAAVHNFYAVNKQKLANTHFKKENKTVQCLKQFRKTSLRRNLLSVLTSGSAQSLFRAVDLNDHPF